MIRFLIERPIAVILSFLAFVILGLVTCTVLSVSLLPDIAVPEISVRITQSGSSAREIEREVVSVLRQQLQQVSTLDNMVSEALDGSAVIRLEFDYGTDTDLAFIEVNEKIDAAMGSLPEGIERPRVIKASVTDIPAFYLSLTLRDDTPFTETSIEDFLELSDLTESVFKRRLEQLPEVAMVDMTGLAHRQVQIVPDMNMLEGLGIGLEDIETAIRSSNIETGSMLVRDGYYEYNIRLSNFLRTVDDVRNVLVRAGERILTLDECCDISLQPDQIKGISTSGGKRAVTMAIIKRSSGSMSDLKAAVEDLLTDVQKNYPKIEFAVSRNQTELLDYTISNLWQNLLIGFLLIFLVTVLCLGDHHSPLAIALSMGAGVSMTFLLFYLFDVSLNIVSISGIILALGMMIDSCIIITDNITQYRDQGFSVSDACVKGTEEVITPMLSSALTTVAVFVPLVFMSGIAGALFYDQAFAVTAGLAMSCFTGILLLPVLYNLLHRKETGKDRDEIGSSRWNLFSKLSLIHLYDAGISWTFSHKKTCIAFIVASVPLCVLMFRVLDVRQMPELSQTELVVSIQWNENIHLDENRRRVNDLAQGLDGFHVTEQSARIGLQDYVLEDNDMEGETSADIYLKTAYPKDIPSLQAHLRSRAQEYWPLATLSFSAPETVFERLFPTSRPDVTVMMHPVSSSGMAGVEEVREIESLLAQETGTEPETAAFQPQYEIRILQEQLLLYGVRYEDVVSALQAVFGGVDAGSLHSFQQYMSVNVSMPQIGIHEALQKTFVRREDPASAPVPLSSLVKLDSSEDMRMVTASRDGVYIPYDYYDVKDESGIISGARDVAEKTGWNVSFSGSLFQNHEMLNELLIILLVSILMMYLILAAQFESFVQPLIVLLEIPIDVAFALFSLWLFGHTLNLMSAIGIIVTVGIIINDSILKLDMINKLREAGVPLMEAIHEAGHHRLRSIIMTSLTTILAMSPLLFSSDMGSELQKPLSIAMIGAMVIGTAVSLFIIPLVYSLVYKDRSGGDNQSMS